MGGLYQQRNPPVGSQLSKLPWFCHSRHCTAIILIKKQKWKTLIKTVIALPVTWKDSCILEDWLRKPMHVKNRLSQYRQSSKNPCADTATCFLWRESARIGLPAKTPEGVIKVWFLFKDHTLKLSCNALPCLTEKLIHPSPFNTTFVIFPCW